MSPEETLEIMAMMEAAEMSANRGGEPVTIEEAIAFAQANLKEEPTIIMCRQEKPSVFHSRSR